MTPSNTTAHRVLLQGALRPVVHVLMVLGDAVPALHVPDLLQALLRCATTHRIRPAPPGVSHARPAGSGGGLHQAVGEEAEEGRVAGVLDDIPDRPPGQQVPQAGHIRCVVLYLIWCTSTSTKFT